MVLEPLSSTKEKRESSYSVRARSVRCPYRYPPRTQRAFTLLELLVVFGVTTLLLGLTFPALRRAGAASKQSKCLSHLHALATAASLYASEDRRGLLLPAHPTSDVNPLHDDGYFDFGGESGAPNVWDGARYGPRSMRSGDTRPLNPYIGDTGTSSVFRCPDDAALPRGAADGSDLFWAPAMQEQSMYESVGTSYAGNAYRSVRGKAQTAREWYSIGPFLRPSGEIVAASEVLLFFEATMWHNVMRDPGSRTFAWQGMPGWHGRQPRYTAAFCDGHASALTIPAGSLPRVALDPPDPDGLALRGGGFRFDCLPSAARLDRPR